MIRLSRGIFALGILAFVSVELAAQGTAPGATPGRTPIFYTTPPKISRARAILDPLTEIRVDGQTIFTVTRANDDDTITGTLNFALDTESRTKLAEALKKRGATLPATFTMTGAVAHFQKGTACPIAHLEIEPLVIDSAAIKLNLPRLSLTIVEGKDEITPQLCFLARQIGTGRMRRGVIAALNRMIQGDTEPQ
jgi:hypothetical protein